MVERLMVMFVCKSSQVICYIIMRMSITVSLA
jgi:hypothetical protein